MSSRALVKYDTPPVPPVPPVPPAPPVELLGVDAAIIFADLLLPVEPMGLKLRYATGEGRLAR